MASRTRRTMTIGLLPLLAFVTSCGGDGVSQLVPGASSDVGATPTDAPAATDAPPATDAPAATDAPVATDVPAGTDTAPEDDGGISTGLLVVLILLGVGVLVAVIMAATRRQPSATSTSDPRRLMLSTAKWIHDQLSLEILALPAADAQTRWNTERVRFDQLVIDLRSIAPSQRSPNLWDDLAVAVAALASALDTAVRVRASQDVDPDLARESVAIANGRRADVQRTLFAVEQSM